MKKLDSPLLALKMEGGGPRAQVYRWPLEARKHKEMDSLSDLTDRSVALPTP